MRRLIIALIVIVLLAGGWYGYDRYQKQQQAIQEAEQASQQVQVDELANVIWASGKLEPVTWANLSPAMGGLVTAIAVQEGDQVNVGDLLLEVDNAILRSQVDVAQAAVSEAEAARARLLAGATDAELSAARAGVASAQAQVAIAAGQMQEASAAVDTAAAQVSITQRQYAELASHPTNAERTAAAAQIAVAQAAVEQAQAAYNLVRGDPNIAAMPQAMTLRQATASLESAKAQGAFTTQGASAEQLSVLAGQITLAQAQLAAAKSRMPSTEAAVKAALAQQASAQASLDNLLAGASAEDVAMADARVKSASAALASAQANLRQTQVIAPFAGQVGVISVRVGEMASPGEGLLLLGDTTAMHVQTTDLRETDVVRLHTGMVVEVTFDALPGRVFAGEVTKIAPVSNTEKGSTNYTVGVDIAEMDPSLRWGMTAFVNIRPE